MLAGTRRFSPVEAVDGTLFGHIGEARRKNDRDGTALATGARVLSRERATADRHVRAVGVAASVSRAS